MQEAPTTAGGEAPSRPVLSVVIPLYQEGAHLPAVVARIAEEIRRTGETFELILVDDGSADDTWEVIGSLAGQHRELRGLRLSRNFGKEAALCAGIDAARGAAVMVMDGDLQHPPELIPEMVDLWKAGGVDLVEAVKDSRGEESLAHRAGSRLFYLILRTLSGHNLDDASDFKLMDRRVVEAWRRMGEHTLFFRGMVAWLGFQRARVSFKVPARVGGRSGWTFLRLVRLAITAVTAHSSHPLQAVTLLGGVFFMFAVALGLQTFYNWLVGAAVSGFTTVILLILIVGGVQMLCLGILGAYIARIFEEVKGRPRYVVKERLGAGRAGGD